MCVRSSELHSHAQRAVCELEIIHVCRLTLLIFHAPGVNISFSSTYVYLPHVIPRRIPSENGTLEFFKETERRRTT